MDENTNEFGKRQLTATLIELIHAGSVIDIKTSGHSMIPFLNPGQSIKIVRTELQELMKGDLIAFRRNDYIVVHRIVGFSFLENVFGILTKGDSNINLDPVITSETYIGKVQAVKRFGKWKSIYSQQFSGKIILFLGNTYSLPLWLFKRVYLNVKKQWSGFAKSPFVF